MIMDTFGSHYSVKIKEFIFPGYSNNIFIDVHMIFVIGDNHKYNTI